MSGRVTEQLAALDGDVDRLRISSPADVSEALAELLSGESTFVRVLSLGEWWATYPRATAQLLRTIARDPNASAALASTVLACEVLDDRDVDEILITAFPALRGAVRDAASDRPGVRRRVGIAETEPPSIEAPNPMWLWPAGRPFPPAETVQGVQARLNHLGLGAGPVDGVWTPLTLRAVARWQVLNGLEPTGELDDVALDRLNLAARD